MPTMNTNNGVVGGKSSTCNNNLFGVLSIFLIISIIINTASTYIIFNGSKIPGLNVGGVKQELLNLEYEKVGGKDNYEIINKAQMPQIEKFIAQYKQQNGGETGTKETPTKTEEPKTEAKTMTKDEIAAIKEGAYIEGNKDTKITIVEYSDLECPYCIRQSKDGTIDAVVEKFGATVVNHIFKNFRAVPHENSEVEAIATLCAGQLGGVEKYSKFYKEVFNRSKGGNGTGFSKDALVPLAVELGLNEKDFQACYDSKKNVDIFNKDTAEGTKFGVQGTPGSVIINNETGKYAIMAGAYPKEDFIAKVEELLK